MKGNAKTEELKMQLMFKGHPEQEAEVSMHVTGYACFVTIGRVIYFSLFRIFEY